MVDFLVQTNLTKAQLREEDDIPTAPLAARKPFELGQPLMWPELINHLPTKMRALHNWYLKASAEGQMVISALVKDEHYFRGTDEIIIFRRVLVFVPSRRPQQVFSQRMGPVIVFDP